MSVQNTGDLYATVTGAHYDAYLNDPSQLDVLIAAVCVPFPNMVSYSVDYGVMCTMWKATTAYARLTYELKRIILPFLENNAMYTNACFVALSNFFTVTYIPLVTQVQNLVSQQYGDYEDRMDDELDVESTTPPSSDDENDSDSDSDDEDDKPTKRKHIDEDDKPAKRSVSKGKTEI